MQNPIRWTADFVRQLPRTTKIVSVCLTALGFALLLTGWRGDAQGWWDNRAFLTNVLSSLTGLCFAIPFALVVFDRLAEPHAVAADKRRAKHRAEFYIARHKAAREQLGLLSTAVKALPAGASPSQIQRLVMNHWRDVEAAKETWRRLQGTVADGLAENRMTLFTSGGLDGYASLMDRVHQACNDYRTNRPSTHTSSFVQILDFVVQIDFQVYDD
jgi:hypothetical protein